MYIMRIPVLISAKAAHMMFPTDNSAGLPSQGHCMQKKQKAVKVWLYFGWLVDWMGLNPWSAMRLRKSRLHSWKHCTSIHSKNCLTCCLMEVSWRDPIFGGKYDTMVSESTLGTLLPYRDLWENNDCVLKLSAATWISALFGGINVLRGPVCEHIACSKPSVDSMCWLLWRRIMCCFNPVNPGNQESQWGHLKHTTCSDIASNSVGHRNFNEHKLLFDYTCIPLAPLECSLAGDHNCPEGHRF